MITNKTVCKIWKFLTFLLGQFVGAVLVTFAFFVDKFSITTIISSQLVTEVSAILLKYLLFSQIYVLGFQL